MRVFTFTEKTSAGGTEQFNLDLPPGTDSILNLKMEQELWKRTKLATIPTFSDKNYYFTMKFSKAVRPN